ncbi:MAG: type I-E CRISPR-associated protein Cse1/CasA [Cellulomonadaceae bacterium]|nr:type I-E CRISPR-associated protein Cse1/CasA [Cellulomonadaceae bacterium]
MKQGQDQQDLVPYASVSDLPWIPVRELDGTPIRLGLRQVLARAHELDGLGTDSAIELSSLYRFLTAVTALVVREMGGVAAGGRLDAGAVDAVLDRHADALYLRHPTTPFAQEWHYDEQEPPGKVSPMDSFRFESPGATSKSWQDRGSRVARWMPAMDLGVVALHLACHWFHGLGGNARSLHPDVRCLPGAIGSQVGNDLAVFWRGQTLAASLLANTPRAWVRSVALPAFLDRTGITRGPVNELEPLWALTYTPNAILLCWSGDDVAGYRPGGSVWGLVDVRTADEHAQTKAQAGERRELRKAAMARLKRLDPARLWTHDGKGELVQYKKMRADQAPLVRLREWYQAQGGKALTATANRQHAVAAPDLASGLWTLEFYSALVELKGMAPMFADATWFTCDPDELDLDEQSAEILVRVAQLAESLAEVTGRAMQAESGPLHGVAKGTRYALADEVRARFWVLAEDASRAAIAAITAHGEDPTDTLRQALGTCALTAFTEASEPFLSTATAAAVLRARQEHRNRVLRLTAPITTGTTPQEDAA